MRGQRPGLPASMSPGWDGGTGARCQKQTRQTSANWQPWRPGSALRRLRTSGLVCADGLPLCRRNPSLKHMIGGTLASIQARYQQPISCPVPQSSSELHLRHLCAGVAAAHSHHLTSSRAVTQHVMDAVDVIVGSPRALPKPLEAMLFQSAAPGMQVLHDTHGCCCKVRLMRCALLLQWLSGL